MKISLPLLLLSGATSFLVGTASVSLAEIRTFTNSKGSEIQAEIKAVVGDKATVTMAGGKEFSLPIAQFSAEDQTFIRDWASKNKNPVARTALRLEIKKSQAKIRVERLDGEKKADHKKRQDASDKSETFYVLNLQNTTRQPIEDVELDYKIFKRVSRRGFDDDDGSNTEETLVRNKIGSVEASALQEIELDPYLTEDIYIKGDKKKKVDDMRQNETLLGIVVKVSAGGKELYKQSLPTNLMDRITEDHERDKALAAQKAERQARKDAIEAAREARKNER